MGLQEYGWIILGQILVKAPIIVDDHGDVLLFDSVALAESYLEPVEVKRENVPIYDCEGRLLAASLIKTDKKIAFSWSKSFVKVVIQPLENEPSHQEDLRKLLIAFLSKIVAPKEPFETYSLEGLIEMSKRFKTD